MGTGVQTMRVADEAAEEGGVECVRGAGGWGCAVAMRAAVRHAALVTCPRSSVYTT